MREPKNDGPQWVPYQPPPPGGRERARRFIRRAGFPLMLLLFVVALGVLLYLSPQFGTNQSAPSRFLGTESASRTPSAPPSPSPGFLDSIAAAQTPSATDGADDGTDRLEAEAGALGTGFAQLSVFSEPSGATVLIDSDSIGITPINRHAVRSGVYIITVQRESYFAADTVAILRNDQSPIYSVTLTPRTGQAAREIPPQEPPALAGQEDVAEPPPESVVSNETESDDPVPSPPASDAFEPPERTEPVVTTGELQFTSTPAGALVQLDGEVVGTTPLTLTRVEAGLHDVVFTHEGHDTSRTQVILVPTEERSVQATLNPLSGRLRILVRPWGSIYIDGQLHERNADVWYETSLPLGEHQVEAVHPALGRRTRTVTVEAGEPLAVTLDLRTP